MQGFRVPAFLLLVAVLAAFSFSLGCAGLGRTEPPPAGGNPGGGGTPPPSQPAVTITAAPATINAGDLTTLTWNATNATAVTITPEIRADVQVPLAMSDHLTVTPDKTTTYTITATGPNGTATATVTVIVNQVPPTLTLTAAPASIINGQSSTLSWTSTHATTITIDNGIGAVAAPAGNVKVQPTATTTYTATATGLGGTVTATATVTVADKLAITLTAAPTSITAGQKSTLTWKSQGATAVNIQPGVGTVNLSGSMDVSPTQTTTYTATATDAAGNKQTATATVTLIGAGSLQSIKHIVFLIQENRSFDSYFARLGDYRASKGLPAEVDGAPLTSTQVDATGATVPFFHFRTVCHEGTTPAWNTIWSVYNGGKLDRFVKVKGIQSTIDPQYHRVMGFYDQRDLPYYYELATQFATSDRFFAGIMGPTIPNRMVLFTGTSFGHVHSDDPRPAGGWPQKTLFEVLQQNGIRWKYYFMDNSLYLPQFAAWNDPAIRAHVLNLDDYFTTLASPTADRDFPEVVFIERGSVIGLDEHPGNNLQKGAAKVKQMIDALMNSTAWQSSVFILAFDESGGIFDHVAPFQTVAPDDIAPILQPGDFTGGTFALSGFRIPFILISPWVKKNFVSHTNMELTSILKLIETRFNLPPLSRRDAAAPDMTEFFDFTAPSWMTPPPLPDQPTTGTCNYNLEAGP